MSGKNPKLTTVEIAREAGVSRTTVSRVFLTPERVRKETRDRVLEVARSRQYFPHRLAGALRSEAASRVVSIVVPNIDFGFQARIVQGALQAVRERGYQLLVFDSAHSSARTDDFMDLLRRQVSRGVIFCFENDEQAMQEMAERMPVVSFEYRSRNPGIASLCLDMESSVRFSLDYLAGKLGHRRIAAVAGREGDEYTERFLEAFRREMARQGLELLEERIWAKGWEPGEGAKAVRYYSRQPDTPTLLLFLSSEQAKEAMVAMAKKGWRPGAECSVFSFDADDANDRFIPRLASLDYDVLGIGRTLAEMLLARLDVSGPGSGARTIVPSGIRRRRSAGHAP